MNPTLDHIVLNTRRLDAMLEFYTGVLDLVADRLDLYRRGEVAFPSVRINEDSIIDLLPESLWNGGEDSATHDSPNLNHFCLALGKDRWRTTLDSLAAAGIDIDSGPMALYGARGNGQAVYIRDPDGNRVELRCYES